MAVVTVSCRDARLVSSGRASVPVKVRRLFVLSFYNGRSDRASLQDDVGECVPTKGYSLFIFVRLDADATPDEWFDGDLQRSREGNQ